MDPEDEYPVCLECLGEIHPWQDTEQVRDITFHRACSELATIKWLVHESGRTEKITYDN